MSDLPQDREPLRVLSGYEHRIQIYRRFPSPRAFLELAAVASGLMGFWLLATGALT